MCNPVMLRWLRERVNLSPAAAAKRLGTKEENLLAWEDETRPKRPTIPQLRRAAKLYKRPLAAFYVPEPPTTYSLPKDTRRLPDIEPGEFSTGLLLAFRLAEFRRDVALSLDSNPPPAEFVGTASLNGDPEELAAIGREVLGVTPAEQYGWRDPRRYKPLNGWKNALESLAVLVFHYTGVEVEEVRGFSIPKRPYPVIAVNGSDTQNGRIFTLAHEFGHLLLGDSAACDLEDYTRLGSPDVPVETFCNRFAGALLVPADELLATEAVASVTSATDWDEQVLAELAMSFGVSREVVLRRLVILGRADEDFYRARRRDLLTLPVREAVDRKGRPSFVQMVVRNVGKPYARLVVDAYRADAITGADVVDYLGAKLKHLPRIERQLTGKDTLTGALP
jgi:Zn-dependent peptidase ImmA (M78 family)